MVEEIMQCDEIEKWQVGRIWRENSHLASNKP